MYGFVPGSTTLIVDDNGQYKAIDLATGDTSASCNRFTRGSSPA
jgi:hypothetical protein